MAYGGEHRGPAINAINWAFTGAAGAIIGIRCFSRARLTKSFGLDDYLTLFALCIVLIYDSILSVAISLGYGNHIEEVSYGNKPRILFLLVISQCFAVYTFTLPKLAFVAILERLLNLRRLTRIILWSLTLGLLAYSTVLCAFWVVQCTPRAYQWNPENHPGSCWKPEILQDLSYFEASTSGALDFFLAVFPPFVIRKLQMPTYKKVMISASLGGGIVGTVVVIYKLTLIKEVNQFAVTDPTYASNPLIIWTTIEANVLLMASSLPAIGPFIRFVQGRHHTVAHEVKGVTKPYPGALSAHSRRKRFDRFYGLFSSNNMQSLPSEADNVGLADIEAAKSDAPEGCAGHEMATGH